MCVSSESHIGDAKAFLTECSADVPCSDPGQTCVCFCTVPCTGDDVCRDQLRDVGLDDSRIECRPPACGATPDDGDSGAVCDVNCLEDTDCAPLSSEHRCVGGYCRRPAPPSETGAGGANSSTCPDGSALVGAPSGDVCMQTTEVTVEDFKACVTDGGCTEPTLGNYFVTGRDTHPIQQVTAAQAEAYCSYTNAEGRLPTRDEWTYAARGGEADTAYPWGATEPASTDVPPHVCALTTSETCPVATYTSGDSPLGLSDLSGNVAELVRDGTDVCVAGGSYLDTDATLLSADSCVASTDPADTIGFRCVIPM